MANGFGIPFGIEHKLRARDPRCVFKGQIVTPRGSSVVPGVAWRQLPHHCLKRGAIVTFKARRLATLETRESRGPRPAEVGRDAAQLVAH